jgi:hypothetical protein
MSLGSAAISASTKPPRVSSVRDLKAALSATLEGVAPAIFPSR